MNPRIFLHVLALLIPAIKVATAANSPLGNATDRQALISFKALISNDPFGALTSWNDKEDNNNNQTASASHYCDWRGVTCSGGWRHPSRVIALDLPFLNLTGSISPHLANLTFLRRLTLPNNHLHGRIPSELGQLPRLQYVNLKYNSLSGEIPAAGCSRLQVLILTYNMLTGLIPSNLSFCPELQHIDLRHNQLEGSIPTNFGSFPKIVNLSLHGNSLTGSIPASLGNLSSLTGLDLQENKLEGQIPEGLGKIQGLGFFGVGGNNLHGSIPPSLFNSTSIYLIGVGGNRLSGTLPPDMGDTLPNLQIFMAFYNQLQGAIPASLPNASKLEEFVVYGNELTSTVPGELGRLERLTSINIGANHLVAREPRDWNFFTSLINCTRLGILSMSDNRFAGRLPCSIANLSTQLTDLIMSGNQISTVIPDEIGNFAALNNLALNDNLLTGGIPDSIGRLGKLEWLTLNANRLSGTLPPSLGNLTQLGILDLSMNRLQGSIPSELGDLLSLTKMNLSYNQLDGSIPRRVIGLFSLSQLLDLSNNRLTGTLPPDVGHLINLVHLDISGNRLSGQIPPALGECLVLQYLYMQDNRLESTIPTSLSRLKGIQEMDLSLNNLSGPVPGSFGNLQFLQVLNLSFNQLQGQVPYFQNASAVSILGNNGLCGGNPELHLKPCPIQSSDHHGFRKFNAVISLGSASVALFLLLCFCAACYYSRSKQKKKDNSAGWSFCNPFEKVSYTELQRATNGFSLSNIIGSGNFSTVYKGTIMASDTETVVAVKVLDLSKKGSVKSFMTECEVLRHIRHRNLLKIVTICSSIDYRGNDFRAIVFEFMPNGTLDEWLHSRTRNLSLVQRLCIAIDVASALDYLHYYSKVPVIHCDLKPRNVLLDDNMTAYVGDFGLAKLLPARTSSQGPSSSTRVLGSIGYIPPEYGMGSKASPRGDVYSYGVLLLEMFTGKRPTDDTFRDGSSLHRFVERAFPERVMSVADPLLLLQDQHEAVDVTSQVSIPSTETTVKMLISIFKIGLHCSKESPDERMEMEGVMKVMNDVRKMLLPTASLH